MIGFLRRRAAIRPSPHPRDERSDAALRSQPQSRPRLSWSRVLIWFMRMMALLWIARGLGYWAVILGAGEAAPAFEDRPPGVQSTIVYFAVIDLIAQRPAPERKIPILSSPFPEKSPSSA